MSSRRICEDPFCYRIAPARYSLTLTDPHLRETSRSLGWGYLLPLQSSLILPAMSIKSKLLQLEVTTRGLLRLTVQTACQTAIPRHPPRNKLAERSRIICKGLQNSSRGTDFAMMASHSERERAAVVLKEGFLAFYIAEPLSSARLSALGWTVLDTYIPCVCECVCARVCACVRRVSVCEI